MQFFATAKIFKNLFQTLCVFTLLLASTSVAHALYISAVTVPIKDDKGEAGNLVSYVDGIYSLSTQPYDPNMFGVIVNNPDTAYVDLNLLSPKYVVSFGEVTILATNSNGSILEGDFVTTSAIEGVGMLATGDGFILGVAQQDLITENPEDIGRLKVLINIRSTAENKSVVSGMLSRLFSQIDFSALDSFSALKYVISFLIVAMCLIFTFYTLNKVSAYGVTALGRNPLAANQIKRAVTFNYMLVIVILIAGLLLSYFILVV